MHKNKTINILSHILVWLVLFCIPYLLSYGREQDIDRIIAHFWIPLFFSVIVFYINYFVMVERFLFTKKTLQFILINTAIIVFILFLKETIEDITITLDNQVHIINISPSGAYFIYLAVDSSKANLGITKSLLNKYKQDLNKAL